MRLLTSQVLISGFYAADHQSPVEVQRHLMRHEDGYGFLLDERTACSAKDSLAKPRVTICTCHDEICPDFIGVIQDARAYFPSTSRELGQSNITAVMA
ncbi:hypothetical protein ATO11_20435 [Pseudaestuariivita atlantica]|uniref:Uncharacterized protein n=1 Tax=Pseudaestuariivita atlantica TaxID=1317121 RepID=A0A0L1JJB1_9RHOB|nr:hypothetical protein ATO11_20435 [Pseudaestuariivita atlantica]